MMRFLDLVLHVRVGRHARKHECEQHQPQHETASSGSMDGLRWILSQVKEICGIAELAFYRIYSRKQWWSVLQTFSTETFGLIAFCFLCFCYRRTGLLSVLRMHKRQVLHLTSGHPSFWAPRLLGTPTPGHPNLMPRTDRKV